MKFLFKKIFHVVLVVYVFFFAYQWGRPIPEVLSRASKVYRLPDQNIHFLADETYLNQKGERVTQQTIWTQIFHTIAEADHVIVLDMFLFNDFQGTHPEPTRALSSELTNALIAKREQNPHTAIALITDPINTVYGGVVSPFLLAMQSNGVFLVTTDLAVLRDSNLLWSAFWRPFVSVWGNSPVKGFLPHPFQANGQKVSLRSWLTLLNFKANHRKLLVADEPILKNKKEIGRTMTTIVTSSNPHDGSSAHDNVALKIDGLIWEDALQSESEVAKLSHAGLPTFGSIVDTETATGSIRAVFLHETGIKKKALELIDSTKKNDTIELEMFYLSERSIINALIDASERGAAVRIILDPNKDAFGHTKNGIPNRPVAKELISRSRGDIKIRWCDTHGEQCHGKLLMGKTASSSFLMLGSANFTRRNIDGFNLEADIALENESSFTAWNDALLHFNRLWENTDGTHTTDYDTYADRTIWKSSVYRVMEFTGLSSF